MGITIENGCSYKGEGIWEYRWSNASGHHSVDFIAGILTPAIGDMIVDGELVPLVNYKVNSDTSKWRQHYDEEWPER